MRFSIVTSHLPQRQGVAAGRLTRALAEGLVEEGHDLHVLSYSPEVPVEELPDWCEVTSLQTLSRLEAKARAVMHPRAESWRLRGWVHDDSVAVADEYPSYPAIAEARRRVLLEHHATRLDVLAVRRAGPKDVQRWRAETAALRESHLVVASSPRVAASIRRRTSVCAPGFLEQPLLPPVDAPVAAVLGDWRWAPNHWALDRLLRMWPTVRDVVPTARLLVAGNGSKEIGVIPGVTPLGRVTDSLEILAQSGLVPFPCPTSSGPKVKVLEALSVGRPVITTRAGFEGISAGTAAVDMTRSPEDFAMGVAELLVDGNRREQLGVAARSAVRHHHSPVAAARRFVAACGAQFPELMWDAPASELLG